MSEPSHLIPNVDEIMESYTEVKEETVQEIKSREMQEEAGARKEPDPLVEESGKRKRGAEEAEAEQRNEKVRRLISDKVVALMEKSLKDKGFIVERGFKKPISPFSEMLEKRGWQSLGEHKEPGYAALVKEFFANMVEEEGRKVYVRGKWIDFSKEKINGLFNLKVQKDGSKFKRLLKEPEYQKIVDLLTAGKGKWKATKKTPYESIARGDLIEEAKVWFYFISSVLLPSKHLSTIRRNEAILLYALLKGYKINVGKIIENSILSYSRSRCRGLIPHPVTITNLCLLGGVQGDWEEKEKCPRTSPLTLTGITKGPKNRGRGRVVEAVREEEEEQREIQQPQQESEAPKLPQRQRSLSPILTFSPEVRQVHKEHAESSEPLGNNTAVLKILNAMRKEMQERDNRLKIQLQLRDEYMDAKLKRRDQNLEETLKQRDEEWKSRWELREQELSAELKAIEDAFLSDQVRRDSELLKIMKEREDAMEKNLLQTFGYLYKKHQKEIRTLIEKKDKEMEGTLNYREKCWTESLDMINKNLLKMYSSQGEFVGTLNSFGQRQNEMIKQLALTMELFVLNRSGEGSR